MNDTHSGSAATNVTPSAQVKPELLVLTEKDAKRFWSKVDKDISPKGCWIWSRGCHIRGYGKFSIGKRPDLAHRISYMMHNGPIPEGMWVLHKCDIRNCVNPEHLRVATPPENVYDTLEKGRFKGGPNNDGVFMFEVPNGGYPAYPAPLDPSLVMTARERYNYERKIDRSGGPDACHLWTGSTQVRGYGIFGLHGKLRSATQLAIRIYSGPMVAPYALHRCDNPRCCNHRHLWAGTQKENADDREEKGRGNRTAIGDKHPFRIDPSRSHFATEAFKKSRSGLTSGANNPNAIILPDSVMDEIRSLEGIMTQREIGDKFGISDSTVWRMLRRNDWRSGVKRTSPSSESAGSVAH